MLRPCDIAKLLSALRCELTPMERKAHMDLLDDIFWDRTELSHVMNLPLTLHLFGSDMGLIETRLSQPEFRFGETRRLNIFILISAPIGQPWESAECPRWACIDASHEDINAYAYDNARLGDTTPWIPLSGRLTSRLFGFPFHFDNTLKIPCLTITNGKIEKSWQHGRIYSKERLESVISTRQDCIENYFVVGEAEVGSYIVFQLKRSRQI